MPPAQVFGGTPPEQSNYFRFRVGPDVAIALGAHAKQPGNAMQGRDVELFVSQSEADSMEAYERLIGDAMTGDAILFAREDEVEAAWAVVDPALHVDTPLYRYACGSWGPPQSEDLIAGNCGWHNPGLDAHGWTRSCGKAGTRASVSP